MLPMTTSAAILAIVVQCTLTTKGIHDIFYEFKNVPYELKNIKEEAGAVEGSLSSTISTLKYDPELLEVAGLTTQFENAIESCQGVLVRVEAYLASRVVVQWKQRVKAVWNEKELRTLRDELRSKQSSLSMLVQALNM
jgi:hypothetical protein